MKTIIEWVLVNGGIPVIVFVIGWLSATYLKKWLDKDETGKRKEGAQKLANLADSITDELVKKYPNIPAFLIINSIVDKIIQESGLKPENAQRLIDGALLRAGLTVPEKKTMPLKKINLDTTE